MQKKSSIKSFSVFLDALNEGEQRSDAASPGAILRLLSESSGSSMPMNVLLQESKMTITDFADILETVEKAGLVSREKSAEGETATLTASGAALAKAGL